MDPNVWGPKLWDTVILASFRLPKEDSLEVFKAMKHLIPCTHCLNSYVYYYSLIPPEKHSGPPEKWIWTIHDMVNQKLGKHTAPFSRIETRFKTFTHPVSPYDIFDILLIIATQVKTEEALCAFKTILPIYKKLIRPVQFSEFLTVPSDDIVAETLWVHILTCKNALHEKVGEDKVSRESAKAQYFDPPDQVNTEKQPTPSKSRRRRR